MVFESATHNTHFIETKPYNQSNKLKEQYAAAQDDVNNVLMQSQDNLSTLQDQSSHQNVQQQMFSRCNKASMNALLERTHFPLTQENGQRKYGPDPNYTGTLPNEGCEVFIGKIPRDCFEDELVPVCENIGNIYEIRLMMDFNGYNRGYAFVMYTRRDEAKRAVKELNNYEIRKGRLIGVCHSVNNCRLFVGGIPKNKKKEDILDEMKKITDFVRDVIVYPMAHDKTKNRGFAFVEYENHKAAAVARRKLLPGRIQLWGHQIAVDWAEPETDVDEDVMAGVKNLYVRNLMLSTTEEQIKAEFEKIKKGSVERVKKLKDFAFVHFKEREDAIHAMDILNNQMIDGSVVEITIAKPVDKNNYVRFTRGVISPTSQLAGACLAPGQLLTNQQAAIHLAGLASQFPHLAPPQLPILQAPLSPTGTSSYHQRISQVLPPQFGATPQEFIYDMYSGLELPIMQINPMQIKMPIGKPTSVCQILEDVCAKQGLGMPTYSLHTTEGRDIEGREVGLYLYKIAIPCFMNGSPLSPKVLSCTLDEAKNVAAEYALNQLGLSTIPTNDYYNQPGIAQSPNSLYQGGRPLSAHQNGIASTNTPVTNSTPITTGPPEYVPLVATSYFFDPATQCVVSCQQPTAWQ